MSLINKSSKVIFPKDNLSDYLASSAGWLSPSLYGTIDSYPRPVGGKRVAVSLAVISTIFVVLEELV